MPQFIVGIGEDAGDAFGAINSAIDRAVAFTGRTIAGSIRGAVSDIKQITPTAVGQTARSTLGAARRVASPVGDVVIQVAELTKLPQGVRSVAIGAGLAAAGFVVGTAVGFGLSGARHGAGVALDTAGSLVRLAPRAIPLARDTGRFVGKAFTTASQLVQPGLSRGRAQRGGQPRALRKPIGIVGEQIATDEDTLALEIEPGVIRELRSMAAAAGRSGGSVCNCDLPRSELSAFCIRECGR